ncbi:hypothetical protein PTTG_25225 [Puccinia triticina 1-1 BBBD Race 1]|uniref:RRM domain-containing protein n=2 Tax=Puccinia triticina TaxID=208348 RepID=A0A180H3M6_PUCT1|nr:uncharacterized protein PtA15_2A408 [Puccinia triticina]OAV99605.1 hypothetical protein PTTG_25225 [Puccinia triticina 1-1 BBBD Race 1]WAQ82095.1 hypothetical protein PtA15_2A408 [Puccinia triticina]WAR52958.1 hypothetical protein PtB15_2B386 [Puccinia triticina]
MRNSDSRSRSPRQDRRTSPARYRYDRRTSPARHPYERRTSPPRYRYDRDRDDSNPKYAQPNGRPGGFSSRGRAPFEDSGRRPTGREMAALEASKRSIKENRVYVGNLAFSVKWNDLKDFMREVGNVVFAEVMVLPNGMSKGCGVVEFSSRQDAERAVKELNDTPLFGRQVFVREDREEEARYGSLAVSGAGGRGPLPSGFGNRGSVGREFSGGRSSFSEGGQSCKQLAISGLPLNVGWQDLKDMFRSAGSIIRADVYFDADGSPTGNGTVIFETSRDAQNAISMFNGFEYEGRTMEVREDRNASGNSGFRGGFRGSIRGAASGRGSFRGGFGSSGPGGRDTSNLYGDYPGQDGSPNSPPGYKGAHRGALEGPSLSIQPSQQIFVKNLPWSTSNDDLVELFQTTGKVENAEVLFEGGRSKGVGVVQFETVEEAETAIAKFQNYHYGGRPLSLEFNGRWRDFSFERPGN